MMLPLSTKVRSNTKINRARLLPRSGLITVDLWEEVAPTHVVAQTTAIDGYKIIDVRTEFGIQNEDIQQSLLVKEGEAIAQGAPLFSKSSTLGRPKEISSTFDGVLLKINGDNLIVQLTNKTTEIRAMISGRVSSVLPGRGVVLETQGSLLQAAWNSGKDGFGTLALVPETAFDDLDHRGLGPETQRKVVVAGRVQRAGILEFLEDNGCRGLITGSIAPRLCEKAENVAYPVLATDGIGYQNMSSPFFDILKQAVDREVSLLSSTINGDIYQDAEIVIPYPELEKRDQQESAWKYLEIGDRVRIANATSSRIGTVIEIQDQPKRLDSGIWSTGADVEFQDGESEFVPYANLDLII